MANREKGIVEAMIDDSVAAVKSGEDAYLFKQWQVAMLAEKLKNTNLDVKYVYGFAYRVRIKKE